MMKHSRPLLALDLGGVCVNVHPERLLDGLLHSEAAADPKRRSVLQAACDDLRANGPGYHAAPGGGNAFDPLALCGALERGKLDCDAFLDAMNRFLGGGFTREQIAALWNLQIGEPVPGMYEAAARLREKGCTIVFFSNTSAFHLAEVRRKCPICELAEDGLYSFETGHLKPESDIYRAFEEKFGTPDLFCDDRIENVAAAGARGWRAVRFRDAELFLHSAEQLLF